MHIMTKKYRICEVNARFSFSDFIFKKSFESLKIRHIGTDKATEKVFPITS